MARGEGLGFDIGTDLLCTADGAGRFTSLNAAWERVLGWSRADLMARPFIEFVHPDDVEATLRESARVAEADYELARFENRYRTRTATGAGCAGARTPTGRPGSRSRSTSRI